MESKRLNIVFKISNNAMVVKVLFSIIEDQISLFSHFISFLIGKPLILWSGKLLCYIRASDEVPQKIYKFTITLN